MYRPALPLPRPPAPLPQYCHANLRIAHRDIKLGNVLLNTRYQIPILKLCDFGYSKSMNTGSVPKTRVGTAAYISPEVARCHGDVAYDTERADVWSCGVTLYCMLAGRYPFMDADQQVRWVGWVEQQWGGVVWIWGVGQ